MLIPPQGVKKKGEITWQQNNYGNSKFKFKNLFIKLIDETFSQQLMSFYQENEPYLKLLLSSKLPSSAC